MIRRMCKYAYDELSAFCRSYPGFSFGEELDELSGVTKLIFTDEICKKKYCRLVSTYVIAQINMDPEAFVYAILYDVKKAFKLL